MAPEAYQIWTEEGSVFLARFDPQHEEVGVRFGRLRVVGVPRTTGRKVTIVGVGCVPEPGSMLTVSDQVIETQLIQGETIPVYPRETITHVAALALPAGLE